MLSLYLHPSQSTCMCGCMRRCLYQLTFTEHAISVWRTIYTLSIYSVISTANWVIYFQSRWSTIVTQSLITSHSVHKYIYFARNHQLINSFISTIFPIHTINSFIKLQFQYALIVAMHEICEISVRCVNLITMDD